MIFDFRPKQRPRRVEPRKSMLESRWREMQANGAIPSIGIAAAFFVVTTCILLLREDVVAYRPGQFASHNITSRVRFDYTDPDQWARLQERARESEPRVYRRTPGDYWGALDDELMTLPDRTYRRRPAELPEDLRPLLDPGDLSALERVHDREREKYNEAVRRYVGKVRSQLTAGGGPLVILPGAERNQELNRAALPAAVMVRYVALWPARADPTTPAGQAAPDDVERKVNVAGETFSTDLPPEVLAQLQTHAEPFPLALRARLAQITFDFLRRHPTHALDPLATKDAQDLAAKSVPRTDAEEHYPPDTVIVAKGPISERDWQVLQAENAEFLRREDAGRWKQRCGIALTVLVITLVLSAYVARYQPRVVRNHARAVAIGAMMISMLLLSALAGIGSSSLYIFGIAPTILAAIILTIAYDQRFAIGVGSIHAILVTAVLDLGPGFFLIMWVGVIVACYLLDEIRTRSKLIEVGGAAAIAMIVVTAASGMVALDPVRYIGRNCLYAGAAGLAAGFVTLGILPFIERAFRITTSMTLLELADASQPLLRRLALEAPGTYNHSLQVATLAEAAAEAIGANSLACRVGAYYHDIGKINKADYFTENQLGGPSRHLNLSPSVSLLIIIGHVKDGMEMAREYNLPTSLLPFIQQHHGTTLVEYFYNEACKKSDRSDGEEVPETQYRYPGPKPKSKETAILMICDAVESACRAMREPNASRIESLVHELSMRRLHDGQFDECDLTMRDLERIERSLMKTLLGIYHGRIAYPSTSGFQSPATPPEQQHSSTAGERKLA